MMKHASTQRGVSFSHLTQVIGGMLDEQSILPIIAMRAVLLFAALVSSLYLSMMRNEWLITCFVGGVFVITVISVAVEVKFRYGAGRSDSDRPFLKVLFDLVPLHPWYVLFQLLMDPALMLIAIAMTGGRASPFHFLILLPVALAGIFFGRSAALALGLISSTAYGAVLVGIESIKIKGISALIGSPVLINVLGVVSGCCLIAVLTNVLKYKFHKVSELAESRRQEVEAMKVEVNKLKVRETKLSYQESLAKVLSNTWGFGEKHESYSLSMPLGKGEAIKKIRDLILKVAPSDATVLVLGESGTGKERVAKAIHENSLRHERPFVAVNCGAIPESLIESELFGHKKGAFTGADRDTSGLFRAAEGGTIFLDEIGELPQAMQAKLLRVLQERVVRPVGGDRDVAINVRVVAATNKNLSTLVEQKLFRDDLYFRLNVIEVPLPPLRERKEDLPHLIDVFVKKFTAHGNVPPVISPTALELLMHYPYPGNIRELENIIERAVVLGGEGVVPDHLPASVRDFDREIAAKNKKDSTTIIQLSDVELPARLEDILESIERSYLEAALKESGGVKKKAAEMLGINFRSIRYRLSKFGLEDEVR